VRVKSRIPILPCTACRVQAAEFGAAGEAYWGYRITARSYQLGQLHCPKHFPEKVTRQGKITSRGVAGNNSVPGKLSARRLGEGRRMQKMVSWTYPGSASKAMGPTSLMLK
jgi:hypothetical protein